MRIVRAVGGVLVALLASPALAQPSSGTWNGLTDRFGIDAGYFGLTARNVLTFNGGNVDFERDLGLDDAVDTFWVDATWRVGRRHQLKLSLTRFSRERADFAVERDFVWGGETYNAGLSATSTSGSDILGGYYRFAAYRNDRFEIGPAIGIGYLWVDARIRATGTIGGASRSLDQSKEAGNYTGALGGYTNGWITKRFVARADYLYIKVNSGGTSASVTDWRLGADYYFFRHAGLGAQYKYNKYTYDGDVDELGGEITYKGFQIFLSFLF
jgi:hypothetical protein